MTDEDFADLYRTEEKLWWFAGMRAISRALLDEFCPNNLENILDVGCGTGLNLKWLERYAKNAGAIKGLDYDRTALLFCRERSVENFLVQASAADLPFASDCFDLVTSFDVLVQLPGAGADEQAVAEMRRVLKSGGIAFARVAAYEWMRSGHDRACASQRRYTLSELTEKMERGGFSILRKTYASSLPFPLAVLRRRVLPPLGLVEEGSDVKPLPASLEWLNKILTRALLAEAKFLR